jgi:xanthine dehydrogenase YagR molybdenum-binding subunit
LCSRQRRYSAFDVGRVLNAKTARSQLLGGIVFGIGVALMEQTGIDEATARYTNANIAEYLVPVNADVPQIDVMANEAQDTVSSPTGAKGIGELPMGRCRARDRERERRFPRHRRAGPQAADPD